MATITLSNAVYNNAKQYAEKQNISVDEFIVSLIHKFTAATNQQKKRKFEKTPVDKLEPELQEILNMPQIGHLEEDDINGEKARMEYYKEKYGLWKSL